MTDGQIILRDIEFPPPHSVTIPNVFHEFPVPFVHNMLYIFILHIRFGFPGYVEHQDIALRCTRVPKKK